MIFVVVLDDSRLSSRRREQPRRDRLVEATRNCEPMKAAQLSRPMRRAEKVRNAL